MTPRVPGAAPLMRQYALFFRMGDFYETFQEFAVTAARKP